MSRIHFNDIPHDIKYEGYYWMSNSTTPVVLHEETLPGDFGNRLNPFIVEAWLYSKEEMLSFHVRNAGNIIIIDKQTITEKDLTNKDNTITIYASERMGEVLLRFLILRTPVPDKQCLGMETLEVNGCAFVGFEHKEED